MPSDIEKSLAIARAMELHVEQHERDDEWFIQIPDEWDLGIDWIRDFYDPWHMPLAWRVLRWGLMVKPSDPPGSIHSSDRFHNKLKKWLRTLRWGDTNAQRLWLDKAYELVMAIEVQ